MVNSAECVVTFPAEGIFGVGRLAKRLKALADADQIGPWHIGHWVDFKHTAIRIRFGSEADGQLADRTCTAPVNSASQWPRHAPHRKIS